ncbi:hypothetical protein [Aminobacterium colombiense]|uniref:Uncharacterized protein n=1 Tax=Aminobacterium colombiense (strain DSM 12261 / ALA-1) TaxID=572547 RepID=D5EEM7_AMICL|nr:hypothetical protein Amico_0878 [Aminobacterium colombiense DSM 12261]MDD3768821.1 hypothetical protein [Aminobacterium colombiense]MDD4266330.1 hypothetical protein [Aminobacterium colombiense]NLK29616.1 hypothetical protein [Aminobacterium colombiense]
MLVFKLLKVYFDLGYNTSLRDEKESSSRFTYVIKEKLEWYLFFKTVSWQRDKKIGFIQLLNTSSKEAMAWN